jgi:phosphoribosylformylglycinamidine cyclo-ligase
VLARDTEVHGLAHITGGGLLGNIPRVLPENCDAIVHKGAWEVPRIFDEIRRIGEVSEEEMARVFNLGIGMVAVIPPDDVMRAHDILRSHGVPSVDIGEVVPGEGAVHLT